MWYKKERWAGWKVLARHLHTQPHEELMWVCQGCCKQMLQDWVPLHWGLLGCSMYGQAEVETSIRLLPPEGAW